MCYNRPRAPQLITLKVLPRYNIGQVEVNAEETHTYLEVASVIRKQSLTIWTEIGQPCLFNTNNFVWCLKYSNLVKIEALFNLICWELNRNSYSCRKQLWRIAPWGEGQAWRDSALSVEAVVPGSSARCLIMEVCEVETVVLWRACGELCKLTWLVSRTGGLPSVDARDVA